MNKKQFITLTACYYNMDTIGQVPPYIFRINKTDYTVRSFFFGSLFIVFVRHDYTIIVDDFLRAVGGGRVETQNILLADVIRTAGDLIKWFSFVSRSEDWQFVCRARRAPPTWGNCVSAVYDFHFPAVPFVGYGWPEIVYNFTYPRRVVPFQSSR